MKHKKPVTLIPSECRICKVANVDHLWINPTPPSYLTKLQELCPKCQRLLASPKSKDYEDELKGLTKANLEKTINILKLANWAQQHRGVRRALDTITAWQASKKKLQEIETEGKRFMEMIRFQQRRAQEAKLEQKFAQEKKYLEEARNLRNFAFENLLQPAEVLKRFYDLEKDLVKLEKENLQTKFTDECRKADIPNCYKLGHFAKD